jgi:hypothetical protein
MQLSTLPKEAILSSTVHALVLPTDVGMAAFHPFFGFLVIGPLIGTGPKGGLVVRLKTECTGSFGRLRSTHISPAELNVQDICYTRRMVWIRGGPQNFCSCVLALYECYATRWWARFFCVSEYEPHPPCWYCKSDTQFSFVKVLGWSFYFWCPSFDIVIIALLKEGNTTSPWYNSGWGYF